MEDPSRYTSGSVGTSSGTTTPRANRDAALPNGHAPAFRIYGRPPQVDGQFGDDTVLLVENTLFHIPTYLLTRQSELFPSLFSLSPGSSTNLRRTLEEAPVDINRAEPAITADQFRAFARALTSPVYNPTPLTSSELTSALDLSRKWAFTTLYNHLLSQLASGRDGHSNALALLPHERLRLAQRYSSHPVLEQALVDQCLSLTPPDMLVYNAVVDCLGPQRFLDLLEARRLIWASLRADHPRRKEGNVWTECAKRPDWCHSNWLFNRALAEVTAQESRPKERNAPYADFDDAFARAVEHQAQLVQRSICETCKRKTIERVSWFVDSAQLFDIVRNTMGTEMLDGAPSRVNEVQQKAPHARVDKGKAKAVQTEHADAPNCKPSASSYLWNAARGLPVEGSPLPKQWERFMNPEGESSNIPRTATA